MEVSKHDKPEGRFNKWCEREPIVCSEQSKINRASSILLSNELTPFAKSVFYLHELTGCMGVEFVAFSNIKIDKCVKLPKSVLLMPCYLPSTIGLQTNDPLVRATMIMEVQHRFTYDGWVPVKEMTLENINTAIRSIDEALALFSLISRDSFSWILKYNSASSPSSQQTTSFYEDIHLQDIETLGNNLDSLSAKDQDAIYRSIAWLAQSVRTTEPAIKLLLSILSFESLVVHIEENTEISSPLFSLSSEKLSKSQKRENRAECIRERLQLVDITSKTESKDIQNQRILAIRESYFNCVTGTKKILQNHLNFNFSNDSKIEKELFTNKVDGYSLYDLRDKIAHGSHNTLDHIKTDYISKRIYAAETLVQQYIHYVLNKSMKYEVSTTTMNASMSLDLHNGIISSRKMYQGPTHIALLYS